METDIFCCEVDYSRMVSMGGGLGFLVICEKSCLMSIRVSLSDLNLLLMNWMEVRREVGDCKFI